MSHAPRVSPLVEAVVAASFEALAAHVRCLFEDRCPSFSEEHALCLALETGAADDLRDPLIGEAGGFDHRATSRVFYAHLKPLLRAGARPGARRGVDRHIWGADYDRHLKSLRPTGEGAARPHQEREDREPVEVLRTRVSAIIQQALLRSRRVFRADKALTATRDPNAATLFMPSPYEVAQRILTDPDAPASEVYASAAIREALRDRIGGAFGDLAFTYDSISRALDGIWARASTSKRARAAGDRETAVAPLLRHYLAAQGVLTLQFEWAKDAERGRPDQLLANEANLFDLALAGPGRQVSFRLHPDHLELPTAGELLNEFAGLPIPVEGAATLFQGGVRFAAGGDIVAALSGPFGRKTSACLALAAALAPLGCRTVFLTCEEAAEDIGARLQEAAPEHLSRFSPLFQGIEYAGTRKRTPFPWFQAHSLRLADVGPDGPIDVVSELRRLLDDAVNSASLFRPFQDEDARAALPDFARPVIIVDGFHQLFREGDYDGALAESSMRELVDRCRELRAVFIFTVAEDEAAVRRLDYLCDLVLQLDRPAFDAPGDRSSRTLRLLKARRQPALIGAHVLHLAGPKSFRIKPNVSSHAEQGKARRWLDPDPRRVVRLSDQWEELTVRDRSQVLVYGRGSSGKAGFGLYLLHRRPVPAHTLQRSPREPDLFGKPELEATPEQPSLYESRTLVISFLYPAAYYKGVARSLRTVGPRRRSINQPNRAILDVISLYPGSLTPEDFLAKVENHLWAAELRGIPYTGVLIDGIHNVYIQYPLLEAEPAFWPQLYGLLRRRGISVVTTHTEFELREGGSHARSLSMDFEHAQRRAAPLLSVLVSAADYVFELSASNPRGDAWEYRLAARSTLGEDPPPGYAEWDRQSCRIRGWQSDIEGFNAPVVAGRRSSVAPTSRQG